MKLGKFLTENGFITKDQLKKALSYQVKNLKLLGMCLIDLQYLTEEQLQMILKFKKDLEI